MAAVVKFTRSTLQKLDQILSVILHGRNPPDLYSFALADGLPILSTQQARNSPLSTLQDLLNDGFLWAVPRNRRSVEKRWVRKMGLKDKVYKMLLPKQNLLVCNACGHYHEAGVLCGNCYQKVTQETEALKEAVQQELGLSPVDKEVVVLYEGERKEKPEEFWEGKRVVEVKRERPQWFSKNLLEKSTVSLPSSSEVKRSELG